MPGNHDISIVDRTNPARLDLPWSAAQALRKLRFILALDEVQGNRARVFDRASGTLGPSLSNYLREDQPHGTAAFASGARRDSRTLGSNQGMGRDLSRWLNLRRVKRVVASFFLTPTLPATLRSPTPSAL